MKVKRRALVLAGVLAMASMSAHSDDLVFGFGASTMTNGLGVGWGLADENSLAFASMGCRRFSSATGASCGVGVSYSQTMPIGDPGHHGWQVGYNLQHRRGDYDDDYIQEDDAWVNRPYVGYQYFTHGIQQRTGVIGVSLSPNTLSLDFGYLWR